MSVLFALYSQKNILDFQRYMNAKLTALKSVPACSRVSDQTALLVLLCSSQRARLAVLLHVSTALDANVVSNPWLGIFPQQLNQLEAYISGKTIVVTLPLK